VAPVRRGGARAPDATPGAAPAASASAVDQAQPSDTAAMVCGDDVVGDVSRALALAAPPATHSTWEDQLFTCEYSLPMGPLVLSVKESPDPAAAGVYFDGRQTELAGTAAAGLGERAFSTPTGTVVVVKDAMTLTVDATSLPEVFGDNDQRRGAFAYEVASIVLGCWTGHE
jgi:hypothetical protein